MSDFIGFSEHMQAYFEGNLNFFGRKVNKVPFIIVTIWGKFNFLGILGVKTQLIISQKSQNSARYAGAFWRKNHFFWKKSQKSALYYRHYLRKNELLGNFWCKTQWIIGQNSKNHARYADAFWGLYYSVAIFGKMNFLGIFGVKTQWVIIRQKSQNSARYAGAFWRKNHFFWGKSQWSALFYRHNLRKY